MIVTLAGLALIPHLVASLIRRRYTAGVVSAVLVVVPECGLILQAAAAAGLTNRAIVLAALAISAPISKTNHRNPIPAVTRASSSAAHVAPG